MIIVTINKVDYKVLDSWKEITISKAEELYNVSLNMPEYLELIYSEKAKSEPDEDQIKLFKEELSNCADEVHSFYEDAIAVLSDIPKEVLTKTYKIDVKEMYERLIFPFVFGVLFYPITEIEDIDEFTLMGETYYKPKEKVVMGISRPFNDEHAAVFCDASDVDSNCKKNKAKYSMAELIIAIIYRKKNDIYTDKEAIETSEQFKNLVTCDIYNSAIYQLSKTNNTLKQLFPNLYQKGDAKVSSASDSSGLSDFGWFSSIKSVATMGILNQSTLTPLESVRQTNLYDFMTVLSSMKADNDFQRIYKENNKK